MLRFLHTCHETTVAADPSVHRVQIALLVAAALGAGIFGFGHHHPADEHHCVLCHAQQARIEPATADPSASVAVPGGRACLHEVPHPDSFSSRLSPPLRGPPAR